MLEPSILGLAWFSWFPKLRVLGSSMVVIVVISMIIVVVVVVVILRERKVISYDIIHKEKPYTKRMNIAKSLMVNSFM